MATAIIAGAAVGTAAVGAAGSQLTEDFERTVFGDKPAGGYTCSSMSKVKIPAKYHCWEVNNVDYELDRRKFSNGVGYYLADPLGSGPWRERRQYYMGSTADACKFALKCRADCGPLDQWWRSVKSAYSKIDNQGLMRRLIDSGCGFNKTGEDCRGVPCNAYNKMAQGLYDEEGHRLEREMAEALADFRASDVGEALAWTPVVGSLADLVMDDLAGERPDAETWALAAVDVALLLVPGGYGVVSAAKGVAKGVKAGVRGAVRTAKAANKLLGQGVVQTVKNASRKAFEKASMTYARTMRKLARVGGSKALREPLIAKAKQSYLASARKLVLDVLDNPEVRRKIRNTVIKKLVKYGLKGGIHGIAAVERAGETHITGLDEEQTTQFYDMVDDMMYNQRKQLMKRLMQSMEKIPDSTYFKMKTKEGTDVYVAQQQQEFASVKAKAMKGDKQALAKFHSMKDLGQDIATKLSERLGYERVLRTQGSTRAIAEEKFRRANGRAQTCSETLAGSWNCVGTQYRKKKADGKWSDWGQPWTDDLAREIRDAKEVYYGVSSDMTEYRRRMALIRRIGYRAAQQEFENEEARLAKDETTTATSKKIAEAKKKGKHIAPLRVKKLSVQDKKIVKAIKSRPKSPPKLSRPISYPIKSQKDLGGKTVEHKFVRPINEQTNTFNRLKEDERQNKKYGKPKFEPRRNVEQLPKQENRREKFKSSFERTGTSYLDLVRDPAK